MESLSGATLNLEFLHSIVAALLIGIYTIAEECYLVRPCREEAEVEHIVTRIPVGLSGHKPSLRRLTERNYILTHPAVEHTGGVKNCGN